MEKARKAMLPLLALIPDFKLSCKNSLKLFHTYIKPIAMYNSENLSYFTKHQIQSMEENKTTLLSYLTESETNTVHQKFLKYILGVKRNCSNMATLGELGEFPLQMHGLLSLLKYWHRVTQMQNETFAKQALDLIINNGQDVSEWFATLKFLLKILNMEEYLENPGSITTEAFTRICSKKLKDLIIQQWKMAISSEYSRSGKTNKLRFYTLFKTSFEMEPYLENVTDFKMRKYICKFRCSDHRLEIELGRHSGTRLEERICKLCREKTETETHFLTECPLYTKLRTRYIANCRDTSGNILQCKDKTMAYNLANFLIKAFDLRKRMLELHAYFK